MRRIAQLKKYPKEGIDVYLRRATKVARRLYVQQGHALITETFLRKHHRCLGMVSGATSTTDVAEGSMPRQLVKCVLLHEAEDTWQALRAESVAERATKARRIGYKLAAAEQTYSCSHRPEWRRKAHL